MNKASISIFRKSIKYPDGSESSTPPQVFEAAMRVMESRGIEVIKGKDGFYVVQYSESGPFIDIKDPDWLPVYVARVAQWTSGGIKKEEMEAYRNESPAQKQE